MPNNNLTIWSTIGNFGILVLAALGLKGRIDTLEKTVVSKDTCKTCGNGHDKELSAFREEMRLLRTTQEQHHREQMKVILELYKHLPKRGDD